MPRRVSIRNAAKTLSGCRPFKAPAPVSSNNPNPRDSIAYPGKLYSLARYSVFQIWGQEGSTEPAGSRAPLTRLLFWNRSIAFSTVATLRIFTDLPSRSNASPSRISLVMPWGVPLMMAIRWSRVPTRTTSTWGRVKYQRLMPTKTTPRIPWIRKVLSRTFSSLKSARINPKTEAIP